MTDDFGSLLLDRYWTDRAETASKTSIWWLRQPEVIVSLGPAMSGALTAAEISAAVSAVTTAVVGTLLNWGSRIPGWMRGALPDDHTALHQSFRSLTAVSASSDLLPILIAAAPSRRLRREGFDPDVVTRVVVDRLGNFFEVPQYSSVSLGMRYAIPSGNESGDLLRQLHVSPNGAVALDWTVQPVVPADETQFVELSLLDVLKPMLMVYLFVRSDAYDQIYRRRRLRFRRRCDWYISVAGAIRRDARQLYWIPSFVGRPAKRAADQWPSSPLLGFASRELRGWPTTRSWEDFARVALKGFLQENGFHDVQAAVEDTIHASKKLLIPEIESEMHLSFEG